MLHVSRERRTQPLNVVRYIAGKIHVLKRPRCTEDNTSCAQQTVWIAVAAVAIYPNYPT